MCDKNHLKINNNKGFSTIISTILLLIVAIIAIILFGSWYHNFNSDLCAKVETSGINTIDNSKFFFINKSEMCFINDNTINIKVKEIIIDNINCNTGIFQLSPGANKINLGECTNELGGNSSNIIIITEKEVYKRTTYIELNYTNSTTLNNCN